MHLRITVLLALLAAAGLAFFSQRPGPSPVAKAAPARAAASAAERTGDVIVRFKPAATLAKVAGAIDAASADAKASTGGSRLVLLRPRPGQSVDDAVAELQSDPNVEFAEPDIVVKAAVTPNDTYYGTYQWPLVQTGMETAWNTTTGSAGVIVAVIDTGVDAANPDLTGKIAAGANAGYNFVGGNTNTADDNGHGTFVAGIIGANSNNSIGMAGICWACQIMPVKVLDSNGSGSIFNVSQGIDWAVSRGAKVLNLSLGASTGTLGLQASVDNAWSNGRIVVAASGNDNGPVLYPAAYPNALAVGSTNSAGYRSTFSNWGPELDLVAPGEGILSTTCTCLGYSYGIGSGTSFAAPQVAGVAALMASAGITDRDTIINTLKSTATDVCAAGPDNVTGAGRVNAARAVANSNVAVGATQCQAYGQSWWPDAIPAVMNAGGTYSGSVNVGNSGSLTWVAAGGSTVQFSYQWLNTDGNGNCTTTAVASGLKTPLAADVPFAGTASINAQVLAPPSAGTYCLKMDMVQGATWFSSQGAATKTKTVYVQAPLGTATPTPTSTSTPTATPTSTPADTTPPTVSITSPADSASVSGLVTVAATASDAGGSGVQIVRFYVDGTYIGYDTSAPYARAWDTTLFPNGPHTVRARAYDIANNVSESAITVNENNPDNTPPAVSITSPTEGASVSGTINVAANASDSQGVQIVRFYVDSTYIGYDTSAPYARTWNTTLFTNGAHTVRARAFDWANNMTEDTVSVSVNNVISDVTPPTIRITSPLASTTVSGTVFVTADAADAGGMQIVRFWVDGTYIGYDTSAPYSRAWNTASFSNGAHVIKAKAYDAANNGAETTIVVTVGN